MSSIVGMSYSSSKTLRKKSKIVGKYVKKRFWCSYNNYMYLVINIFNNISRDSINNAGKNVDTKTLNYKYLQSVLYKKEEPEPLVSYF